MQTVLIVIAIFIAVSLPVRYVAPPAKVCFSVKKRLSFDACMRGIAILGKRLSVTEYGFGIKCSSVKPKKTVSAAETHATHKHAELWRLELVANKQRVYSVFSSCKKSIAASSFLGHVGKYPRLFLFCKYTVESLCGDISAARLKNFVAEFCGYTQFTEKEKRYLPDYLRFCLVGLLCTVVKTEDALCADFYKGFADAENGRVDLDRLNSDDYICGLLCALDGGDNKSLDMLFEVNNIDTVGAEERRRKRNADTYAIVKAVVRSLDEVDAYADENVEAKREKTSRGYALFCKVAMPILLFVYALLTCIFASPIFVALFFVCAVITYFALRLPVLLHSADAETFDVLQIIKDKISSRPKSEATLPRAFMTESAVDCLNEYVSEKIDCGMLVLRADNTGTVEISDRTRGEIGKLNMLFSTGKTTIDLCAFDTVIQSHRCVYRTVGDAEISVEIFPSPIAAACVCKVTTINGTPRALELMFSGLFAPKSDSCEVKKTGEHTALSGNNVLYVFTADAKDLQRRIPTMSKYAPDDNVISAHGALIVPPFEKRSAYFVVAVLSSLSESESVRRCVCDARDFDLDYLRVNAGSERCVADVCERGVCLFSDNSTNEENATVVRLPCLDAGISGRAFGYLPGGELYVRSVDCNTPEMYSLVASSGGCARCAPYGIEKIIMQGVSITDKNEFFRMSAGAFIILKKGETLWSPTLLPDGKGDMSALLGFGYAEYSCAYNGILCVQKCFPGVDGKCFLFDVTLKNELDHSNALTVMLSAVTRNGGRARILCSDEPRERAEYKEAYFRRGKIVCVDNFLFGGITPAATLATEIELPANGTRRIVFSLTDRDSEEAYTIADADNAFRHCSAVYSRIGKTALQTSDNALDVAYKRAACGVYTFWRQCGISLGARELYYLICAVKYVDISSVRKRLTKYISEKNCDIYFLLAVAEYVRFSGDGDLLFAETGGMTFAERSMRILDECIARGDAFLHVRGIKEVKSVAAMFGMFNELSGKGDRSAAYISAMCACAEHSTRAARSIVSSDENGLIGIDAAIRAMDLYECGEYDRAYALLDSVNPVKNPDGFGAFMCNTATDASIAALFYTAVTEKFLGLNICGNRARINPCVTKNSPDTEFDLLGASDVHIRIDKSVEKGNWTMKIDKVSYASNSLDLANIGCDTVTLCRDGREYL